jgi:hypothetical protein
MKDIQGEDFVADVRSDLDSIVIKNPVKVMKEVLIEVLEDSLQERLKFENVVSRIRELEAKKIIPYKEHRKEEKKVECKRVYAFGGVLDNMKVQPSCGHKVTKEQLIKHALTLLLKKKQYNYSYLCKACKEVVKLAKLPLDYGCDWTSFGEKVKFKNGLDNFDCGKCKGNTPLSPIDLNLLNDFISFEFAALMFDDYSKDYPKIDSALKDLFDQIISNIKWILKNPNDLNWNVKEEHKDVKGTCE